MRLSGKGSVTWLECSMVQHSIRKLKLLIFEMYNNIKNDNKANLFVYYHHLKKINCGFNIFTFSIEMKDSECLTETQLI